MSPEQLRPNSVVNVSRRACRLVWRAGALGMLVVGTSAFLPVSSSEFRASTSSIGNTLSGDRLAAPTNLSLSGVATFGFGWEASEDDYVVGYRLYRADLAGGPFVSVAEVTSEASMSLTDTPTSGSYRYVLRAFYLSWESPNSNEVESPVVP